MTDHKPVICPSCHSPEQVYKALEPRSYPRGDVDWQERTKPPYPSTPEMLAIRVEQEPVEEKPKKQVAQVAPGVEVPLDTVVKRNKNGAISTASTLGKIVSLALEAGCEVKAGKSEKITWIQGAHHSLRFSVTGTTVVMNGRVVPKEDLIARLEEIGGPNAHD